MQDRIFFNGEISDPSRFAGAELGIGSVGGLCIEGFAVHRNRHVWRQRFEEGDIGVFDAVAPRLFFFEFCIVFCNGEFGLAEVDISIEEDVGGDDSTDDGDGDGNDDVRSDSSFRRVGIDGTAAG